MVEDRHQFLRDIASGRLKLNHEEPTPLDQIPPENQFEVPLPGGGTQVVDNRRTYNWDPDKGMVECTSKSASKH